MEYDPSPLMPDETRYARVSITLQDLNLLIELSFHEGISNLQANTPSVHTKLTTQAHGYWCSADKEETSPSVAGL